MEPQVEKYELHPDAAEHYTHVGPHAVWQTNTGGQIDIRTITVAVIEKLIEAGCEWFVKKVAKKPEEKKAIPAETAGK